VKQGLKLPVGTNTTGGTALSKGEDENSKIILMALSDCDNAHAFQQNIGIGTDMIFDISDPKSQALILSRINLIFQKFEAERRFKLLPETATWSTQNGELILEFDYHDLESDEQRPFSRTFRGRD